MVLRRGVILGLTLLGILLCLLVTWEDRQVTKLVAAIGCFGLARVYAEVTIGDRR
jgi:hypothetical protein